MFGIITSSRFVLFRTLANALSVLTNLMILGTLKRVVTHYDDEGLPFTDIQMGD